MSLLTSLATTAVKTAGLSVILPIVEEEAVGQLQAVDHETIARKVEIPVADVKALCAKTGADPAQAEAAVLALGEAFATMILAFAPPSVE